MHGAARHELPGVDKAPRDHPVQEISCRRFVARGVHGQHPHNIMGLGIDARRESYDPPMADVEDIWGTVRTDCRVLCMHGQWWAGALGDSADPSRQWGGERSHW